MRGSGAYLLGIVATIAAFIFAIYMGVTHH
jgi:hypothetical protein